MILFYDASSFAEQREIERRRKSIVAFLAMAFSGTREGEDERCVFRRLPSSLPRDHQKMDF